MKRAWFRRLGWFFLPISWQAAVLVMLGLLFCTQAFLAIDRHSHSVSDTLYGVFPFWACCFLLLDRVGRHTSEKRHEQNRTRVPEHADQ